MFIGFPFVFGFAWVEPLPQTLLGSDYRDFGCLDRLVVGFVGFPVIDLHFPLINT